MLLADEELAEVRRVARRHRQSVAEWVRAALRRAVEADAGRSAEDKLRILHAGVAHEFPTGAIDQMLDEIGRGYRAEG